MSIYLGDKLVSGGTPKLRSLDRVGQIITSTLPLDDPGLHLLDGSVLTVAGGYNGFIEHLVEIYNNTSVVSNVSYVGDVTDTDGVLSNFSTSNYARIPNTFDVAGGATWEMVWKVTTGADASAEEYFIGTVGLASGETGDPVIIGIYNSKFVVYISSKATASGSSITSSSAPAANTTYTIKLEFTGTAYNLYVDGTLEGTISSSTPIWSHNLIMGDKSGASGLSNNWTGSIDLNDSYININGSRWWTGREKPHFTDEATWQNLVGMYGVCGKFVYNSTNNTIRLPKYGSQILSKELGGTVPVVMNSKNDTYMIYRDYQTGAAAKSSLSPDYSVAICSGSDGGLANEVSNGNFTYGVLDPNGRYDAETQNLNNSGADCYYYIVTSSVELQLEEKADTDLSNLSAQGQAILDNKLSYSQLSNCIVELPKGVDYDISEGVLTVKAGSVFVVPYGITDQSETIHIGDTFINPSLKVCDTYWDSTNSRFFVKVELQEDYSRDFGAGSETTHIRHFAFGFTSEFIVVSGIGTTSSVSSFSGSGLQYNTAQNIVKYVNSGTPSDSVYSFPFAIGRDNATYYLSTMQQTFHGMGYIGAYIWVDKGIKYLKPNGRNANGTLKSIETVTDKIITYNMGTASDGQKVILLGAGNFGVTYGTASYYEHDTQRNYIREKGTGNVYSWCIIGECFMSSSNIVNATFEEAVSINSLCDGEWVAASSTIVNGAALPSTARVEYSLDSVLPSDSYDYEVLFSGTLTTAATSGSAGQLAIASEVMTSSVTLGVNVARTAAAVYAGGSAIIPIGPNRKVIVGYFSNNTGTYSLHVRAFRRIGRNS